jgi:uncharacterized repeat protein (TIGR03803 family)
MKRIKFESLARALGVLAGGLVLLGATDAGAQPIVETVLFNSFPGTNSTPAGSFFLGPDDGVLYGTGAGSSGGGGGNNFIFRVNRDGSGFQFVHMFGAEAPGGSNPRNIQLSVLLGNDGLLYGTTPGGGVNNAGSVFKVGREGSGYTTLHSFSSGDGSPQRLMQAGDGRLYGAGLTIFALDTDGGNYTVLHTNNTATDGNSPFSALVQASDGMLYGTMRIGGSNNFGTIFKLNTNGSGFQVLHSFSAGVNDGKTPYGRLIQASNGALYGITFSGGTNNGGTVFKINTDGGGYVQLYSFAGGSDGAGPAAGLALGIDGFLYGSTEAGGSSGAGDGTIFKIGLDGNGYKQLYNFPNSGDGKTPDASFVPGVAPDGSVLFYGTTSSGVGTVATYGTVFAVLVNPPMTITPAAYQQSASNQVTLFWPGWAQGAVLQQTTNLTSGTWVPVTNGLPVTGIQVTNAAPNVFYRLTWPQ